MATNVELVDPAVAAGDKVPTITKTKKLLEFLDVELTERCNQHCRHCYIRLLAGDRAAISGEMNTAFVCKILKEAVTLGCSKIRFTGGEPLVRHDFPEIYDFAHDLGLGVSVATNATLISDDIADLWVRKKPTGLSVSVYGWNQPSFEWVTQTPGSFRRFLAGVERVKKRGLQFLLRYPPLRPLVQNSDKIRVLAQGVGASYPVPYAWELTLHARHNNQASKQLKALRLDPEEAARERLKEPGVVENDLKVLQNGASAKRDNRLFWCPAAYKRPTVNAYGQLQVCLQVRHPNTLYNLHSGSLYEGLTKFFPRFRKMHIIDSVYLNRCSRCLLRPICPLCPAISWMEYGTLTTPADYYCEITHAEARLLGLLNDGEKGWEIESLHNPKARC